MLFFYGHSLNCARSKIGEGNSDSFGFIQFLIFYNLKSGTNLRKLGYLDSYRKGIF